MRDQTVSYIPPEAIIGQSSPLMHGDFKPVKDLKISDLPQGWRNQEALDVLRQVAQRVVMIYIPHMSSERPTSIFSDCPHFGGTGFAYYVDQDIVKVRTNLHVIYNADEASSATVQFSLQIPGKRHTRIIRLRASARHFYNNLCEDYSSFTCFTTKRLMKYLYVFRHVPVLWDSSFFTNESWSSRVTTSADCIDDPLFRQTEDHGLDVSSFSSESVPKHSPGYDAWSEGEEGWLGGDDEMSGNDQTRLYTPETIDDEVDLDQSRVSSVGIAGMQTAEYCLDYNDLDSDDAVENAFSWKTDSRRNPKPMLENGDYVAILSHPQGSEKCFSIGPAALYDTETLTKQSDFHTVRQTQTGQSTVHLINDRFRICKNRIYHTQSTFGCSGSPVLLFKRSLQRLKIPVVDYSQHSGTCFFRNGDKLGFATCFTPSVFSQSLRPDDDLHQCYSVIRQQEQIDRLEEKLFSKKFGLLDVNSESTHIVNTERVPGNLNYSYNVDKEAIIGRRSLPEKNLSKQAVPPSYSVQKLFSPKYLLPSAEQKTELISTPADREEEECYINKNVYLGSGNGSTEVSTTSLWKERNINSAGSTSCAESIDLGNARGDESKETSESASPSYKNILKDQGSEHLYRRENSCAVGKTLHVLEGVGGYRIIRKKSRSLSHYVTRRFTQRLEEQNLCRQQKLRVRNRKQASQLQKPTGYKSCSYWSSPSIELGTCEKDSSIQTSLNTTSDIEKSCGSISSQFSEEDSVSASTSANCSASGYDFEKAPKDLGTFVCKAGNNIKADIETEKTTCFLRSRESAEALAVSKFLKNILRIDDCAVDHNHRQTEHSGSPVPLQKPCMADQPSVTQEMESQTSVNCLDQHKSCQARNREAVTTNSSGTVFDHDYTHAPLLLFNQNADDQITHDKLLVDMHDSPSFCKDLMECGISLPAVSVANCQTPNGDQSKLHSQHKEQNGLTAELVSDIKFVNANEQTTLTASRGFSDLTDPVIENCSGPGNTLESADMNFFSTVYQDAHENSMHYWTVSDSIPLTHSFAPNNLGPRDTVTPRSIQEMKRCYEDDTTESPDQNQHLACVEGGESEEPDLIMWSEQDRVMNSSEHESCPLDTLLLLSPIPSSPTVDILNTTPLQRDAQITKLDLGSQKTNSGDVLPIKGNSESSEVTNTGYDFQYSPNESISPSAESTLDTERSTSENSSQTLQSETNTPRSCQMDLKELEICDDDLLLKPKLSADRHADQSDMSDAHKLSLYSAVSPKCDTSLEPGVHCMTAENPPDSENGTNQSSLPGVHCTTAENPPDSENGTNQSSVPGVEQDVAVLDSGAEILNKQEKENYWEQILIAPFPEDFFTERKGVKSRMAARFGFNEDNPLGDFCAEQTNDEFNSHKTSSNDHIQQNMSKESRWLQVSDLKNAESDHNQGLCKPRRLILPAPRSAYKLSELKRLKYEWQKRCGKLTEDIPKPASEGNTDTGISSSLQELAEQLSKTERPNSDCTQDKTNTNLQPDIASNCSGIGKWLENREKRSMLKEPLSQPSKANLTRNESFSSAMRYSTVVPPRDTRPISVLRADAKDANVPTHAVPIHASINTADLSNDLSCISHPRQMLETGHPMSREKLSQFCETTYNLDRLNMQPTLDANASNIFSSQSNLVFDPAVANQQPYQAPAYGNMNHPTGKPVVKSFPDLICGQSADPSHQHSTLPVTKGTNTGQHYASSSRLYTPTHCLRQRVVPAGTETTQNPLLSSIWAPDPGYDTKLEMDKTNISSKFLNLDGRDVGYNRPLLWQRHAKVLPNTEHGFNQKHTTTDYFNMTQTASKPHASSTAFQFGAIGSGQKYRNMGFPRQNHLGKESQDSVGSNATYCASGKSSARITPQNWLPVRTRFSTVVPVQRHGYQAAPQNTHSHTEPFLNSRHRPSISRHEQSRSCYGAYAGQHYPFPQSFSETQIRSERTVANSNPPTLPVPFIMNRGTENNGDVFQPSRSNLTNFIHYQPESASFDSSLGSSPIVQSSTDSSSFHSSPEISLSEVNTLPEIAEKCPPDVKLSKLYSLWGSSYRTSASQLAGAQLNDAQHSVTETKTGPEHKWDNGDNAVDKPCKTETKSDVNSFSILKPDAIGVTVPSLSQAFEKFLSADADDLAEDYTLDHLASTKHFWQDQQTDSYQAQKPANWSVSSRESGQQHGITQEQLWTDHREAKMPKLQSVAWNRPESNFFTDMIAYNSSAVSTTSESSKRLVGLEYGDSSKSILYSAFERFLNAAPEEGIETSVTNCDSPALVDEDSLKSESAENCDKQQESRGYDIDSVVRVVLEMGRFYPKNHSGPAVSASRHNPQYDIPGCCPRRSVHSAQIRKLTQIDSDSVDKSYSSSADKSHPSGSDRSNPRLDSADKSNPSGSDKSNPSDSADKNNPSSESTDKSKPSESTDKCYPCSDSANRSKPSESTDKSYPCSDSADKSKPSDSSGKKRCPIRTIRTPTLSKVNCLFRHRNCSKKKFLQKQVQVPDSTQASPKPSCGLNNNNDYNCFLKSDACRQTNRRHWRRHELVSDHETMSAGASAHNLQQASPAINRASPPTGQQQNHGAANKYDVQHADVKRRVHSLHPRQSCLHERRPSLPHNLASPYVVVGDFHLPPNDCVNQYLQRVDNGQHCCRIVPMPVGLPLNNNVSCPFCIPLYNMHTQIAKPPPAFPTPFLQQGRHSCISKHLLGCSHSNSNLSAAQDFFPPEVHQNWVEVSHHPSSQETSEWCTHEADTNCWLDHAESSTNDAFRHLPRVATFDILDTSFIATLKDLDIVQVLHSDRLGDKQEEVARDDGAAPLFHKHGSSETGSRQGIYIKNKKTKRGHKSKRYTKRRNEKSSDNKSRKEQYRDSRLLLSACPTPQQSEDDSRSNRVTTDTSSSGNQEIMQTGSDSGSEASAREVCYVTVPVDIRVRMEKAAKWISTQLFGCPQVHYLTPTDARTFYIQQNLQLTLQIMDLNG